MAPVTYLGRAWIDTGGLKVEAGAVDLVCGSTVASDCAGFVDVGCPSIPEGVESFRRGCC